MKLGCEEWNDPGQAQHYSQRCPREIHHSQLSMAGWGLVSKLREKVSESPSQLRDIALHSLSTDLKTSSSQIMQTLWELDEVGIFSSDRHWRVFSGCGFSIRLPVPDAYLDPPAAGYVYAMRNTNDGLIKIGRTRNIDKRYANLAKEYSLEPEELLVIGLSFVANCPSVESILHRWFHKDWVKGEWFNVSYRLDYLKEAISRHGFYNCFAPTGIVL